MTGFLGQTFGNYWVERILGHGGFADVYLGRHNLSSTDAVAIKVLRDQLSDEKSKVKFQEEASMLLRLNHPGIVHLRDYGIRNDGVAYLIMDYAPNGSLDKKYPLGQRLALPDVVSYVKQIAEALQYAHNEGVIHCDIKPANLLLGNKNQIVIGDFGIATIAQATRALKTGEPVGTIEFMSPEQIKGKPRRASDQYSLAIVVYAWLTKTLPFTGNYGVVLLNQYRQAPPPLCDKAPGLPVAVEKVVLKALSKESNDRYADIQTFVAELEKASRPGSPDRFDFPPVRPLPPVPPFTPPPVLQPKRPIVAPVPFVPPFTPPPPQLNRSAGQQKKAKEWFEKGNDHWFKQNFNAAILAYSEAIKLVPDYAEAWNNRGKAKNKAQQFREAIKDFDRAIALVPGYNWAYSNRGFAYLGLNQYEQAIKDYEYAISLKLQDARTYMYCGWAHEQRGHHGPVKEKFGHLLTALDYYDLALSWDSHDEQTWRNRNKLYNFLHSR